MEREYVTLLFKRRFKLVIFFRSSCPICHFRHGDSRTFNVVAAFARQRSFVLCSQADVQPKAANPLVQEQLPEGQWGTNVVAMSFAGRLNGDTYRILTAESSNSVTISGIVVTVISYSYPWTVTTNYETLTTNLTAGVPCDLILDGPVQFQSTKPIQVAQFANGAYSDTRTDAGGSYIYEGDPCEILLPPVGHWLESNVVLTLTNDLNQAIGDFYANYLNLIVPQSATNSTYVDGSAVVVSNFVAIGSSGYYGAQITITSSGTHTVTSSQPVGAEVYGWGQWDAYSYFGGMAK